jgi:mannose-6-phosphate isomerase-like protein (cupin superfamily)
MTDLRSAAGVDLGGIRRTTMFFLVATALWGVDRLAAQRVVVVYEEPRHRVVVDEGDVKLLDVQILPGDTTLQHTHDSPILYTFINTGSGPSGGRVSSNTQYATTPYTHDVTNNGTELFRIIAMAHYGAGESDLTASRPDGVRGEPQLENEWFRSYRVELEPGQSTAVHRHRHATAIVLVTDGRAEVTRDVGFGAELTAMGSWTWRDPESPFTIRNGGEVPIAVVVNEARRGR